MDGPVCKRTDRIYDGVMNASSVLTRIYCDADLGAGRTIDLGPGPAHKLRAVLRAKPGDDILAFNGRDGEWRTRLHDISKTKILAECREQARPQHDEPGPWLVFAPLKKDRMDHLVEKAVEMGAERLIPVITQRTENRRVKLERLAQQIIDAAEQCERLTLPALDAPVELKNLPAMWPHKRVLLVAAERRHASSLPHVLTGEHHALGLLVGPEGGFDPNELDWLLDLPISKPVNLGPRILRAESAAIAALSVMQALNGDWIAHNENI